MRHSYPPAPPNSILARLRQSNDRLQAELEKPAPMPRRCACGRLLRDALERASDKCRVCEP